MDKQSFENPTNSALMDDRSSDTILNDRFTRTRLLFGDNFEKITSKKILIFGVGGVGGFALDCLYRTGIGDITIVDKDSFDVTNQNRQIGSDSIGEKKIEALKRLYPGIKGIFASVDSELLGNLKCSNFDYVIDAIDDIPAKIELAKECQNMRYGTFICSTGSAKKLNPLEIRVGSIWKSYGDRFARKLRDNLKKNKIKCDFKVIFSPESPKCEGLGSFSAVTASFGLQIASEVIQDIIKGG